MKKPDHVQNTSVDPSWGQLWREIICSIKGHAFYVTWGSGYRGMPQSHCYRCGKASRYGYRGGKKWIKPIG